MQPLFFSLEPAYKMSPTSRYSSQWQRQYWKAILKVLRVGLLTSIAYAVSPSAILALLIWLRHVKLTRLGHVFPPLRILVSNVYIGLTTFHFYFQMPVGHIHLTVRQAHSPITLPSTHLVRSSCHVTTIHPVRNLIDGLDTSHALPVQQIRLISPTYRSILSFPHSY